MENKGNQKSPNRGQRQAKDFLYKIAKLQQNKILGDKTNAHDNDLHLETASKSIQPDIYNFDDFQQQFGELQMPSFQAEEGDNLPYIQNMVTPKLKESKQNRTDQIKVGLYSKGREQNKDGTCLDKRSQDQYKIYNKQEKLVTSKKGNIRQEAFNNHAPFAFDDDEPDFKAKFEDHIPQQADRDGQIPKQGGEKYKYHKPQVYLNRNSSCIGNLKNHAPFLFDDDSFQQGQEKKESLNNQTNQNKKDLEKQQTEQLKHLKKEQKSSSSSSSGSDEQIKGVSITSNAMSGNVIIKITNKKELVISKIPPGIILKCILKRSNNIFNPEYDFYLNNGLKHILSAKKYSLSKRQVFKLSLEIGDYCDRNIIGSILANTVHNKYWFYKQQINEKHMQIKCMIKYDKIKQKSREMKVEMFIDKKKQAKIDSVRMGHDVIEEGDLQLKSCEVNEKQHSMKNYILCDHQDQQYQYIKMYKMSDNVFAVDIQHPISPLQAFAVSLTRFDAELK